MIVTELLSIKAKEELTGPQGKTVIFAVEYDEETKEFFPSVIEQFDNSEFYGHLVGMIAVMRNQSLTRRRNNE